MTSWQSHMYIIHVFWTLIGDNREFLISCCLRKSLNKRYFKIDESLLATWNVATSEVNFDANNCHVKLKIFRFQRTSTVKQRSVYKPWMVSSYPFESWLDYFHTRLFFIQQKKHKSPNSDSLKLVWVNLWY